MDIKEQLVIQRLGRTSKKVNRNFSTEDMTPADSVSCMNSWNGIMAGETPIRFQDVDPGTVISAKAMRKGSRPTDNLLSIPLPTSVDDLPSPQQLYKGRKLHWNGAGKPPAAQHSVLFHLREVQAKQRKLCNRRCVERDVTNPPQVAEQVSPHMNINGSPSEVTPLLNRFISLTPAKVDGPVQQPLMQEPHNHGFSLPDVYYIPYRTPFATTSMMMTEATGSENEEFYQVKPFFVSSEE